MSDLYELRNLVAHGREIPKKPFREEYDILDINGDRINTSDCFYADVIMDAALSSLQGRFAKSLSAIWLRWSRWSELGGST